MTCLSAETVYVSGVWNSYRKTRLVLLDFIYICSQRLLRDDKSEDGSSFSESDLLNEARKLAEDIAASIPFHLFRNPEVFLSPQQHTGTTVISPNQALGGLLLMHPISAALGLSVVPQHLSEMFRECLSWIGQVMGIGQATLFAEVSEISVSVDAP